MPINHFPFVGTHFKTSWESKGTAVPLARGHPIGAGSALLAGESKGDGVPLAVVSKGGSAALAGGIQRRAEPSVAGRIQRNRRFRGTRLFWKSLVCYTFGDRGWMKGVVRGGNKHFQSATEQTDSASYRTRNPGVCFSRIRLFGCRWCCGMERRSEAEPWNGAASPGEPKGYQALVPPQRRILRHFGNAIVFCFGRSFRSELRISSMALFAYLCEQVVSNSAM